MVFATSFIASPENVTFRYQLVGLDQDWVEAGTVRVARYPNVPPGDYRFRYVADGQWYTDYASHGIEAGPNGWNAVLVVRAPVKVASEEEEELELVLR